MTILTEMFSVLGTQQQNSVTDKWKHTQTQFLNYNDTKN